LTRSSRHILQSQDGLALIAVLWIVAALSVLVIGMSSAVRQEVRTVGSARDMVSGAAFGDAAIQMVLQKMTTPAPKPAGLTRIRLVYRSVPIEVEVTPYNGFIDVNNAPEPLLAALYGIAGRLSSGQADALAQSTISYRKRPDRQGSASGLEVPEDLMRVPGMSYDLYASIAPLVTTQRQGNGKVNPLAAPYGVLLVLVKGNAARAANIEGRRAGGDIGIDTTSIDPAFVDAGTSQRFRLTARVPIGDGAFVLTSRSVDFTTNAREELPWRTFQTATRLEPVSASPH
jgi:general secretion pathway protein K